jgi:hypothetical protein
MYVYANELSVIELRHFVFCDLSSAFFRNMNNAVIRPLFASCCDEKLVREFEFVWVLGGRQALPLEKVIRPIELCVGIVQVPVGLLQVMAGLD